jgi:FAD/FMN-containing dehydrogenase
LRQRDTVELAKAMEICSSQKVPVIPLGGRTGLVGGLRHTGKEVYLSLEAMNRIENIDPINRVATVQAGVILQNLHQGVVDKGLSFPVELRLRPQLPNVDTAFAHVPDFASAVKLRNRVETALGNDLTAFEVMWPEVYEMTTSHRTGRLPLPVTSGIYLLFESEAGTARDSEAFSTAMVELYEEGLVEDMAIAASEADRLGMWAIRNDIEAIIRNLSPLIAFDASLPVSSMERCVEEIDKELKAKCPATRFARFGHMSDNNLHIVVCIGPDTMDQKTAICDIVYNRVTEMNGYISAEHGIGMDKLPWFEKGKSAPAIALMQTIRKALDPNGILNPGKTIP